MKRGYVINVTPVLEARSVGLGQGAAAATSFYNAGTSIAIVKGVRILPNAGWTPFDSVDPNSIDQTTYDINFDTSSGTINNLMVVKIVYQ